MKKVDYIKKFKEILLDLKLDVHIHYGNYDDTAVNYHFGNIVFLHINFDELDNISIENRIYRGHNVKNFYLMAFLHELGHIRQFYKEKFKKNRDFMTAYKDNVFLYEHIADRYAKRIYKFINEKYF